MKRELHPEMYKELMSRLEKNGEAQQNIKEKNNPRRLMILAAQTLVGEREKTGNNDGRIIELIQETIGGHAREPYCLAGVQTMIAFVERVYGIESPVYPTEHCMTCWRETPTKQRVLFMPNPGAIGIYRHGSSDSGHATLFVELETTKVLGTTRKYANNIEFNTTSGVADGEIVREGGGVYWTQRPFMKDVGNMKFIGHLKPF